MTNDTASKERVRGRLRIALAAIAVLVLLLVVPPLINVSHYKGRITRLISQSLARPVRLSSVQVRLLPWPGFEISNLSVAEDPAYGAEPVLYANQVIASIRLLALLRGRVEIGKISVDLATLNLVRAGPGRWNLDPLFRTAAEKAEPSSGARRAPRLPYLEATDSRIDFKNGVEKLPFSLVNADLSFWQESSGEWRIRLRAQPARTDVSLHQEETGIVRIEASVRRAPSLSQMPLHLDLDWREAQLGQLARIITGSDPGWRGDLTGELHLNGTADAAQITMRLRAAGVHRAEFTPASPLDFDANCAFIYHYAQRSLQNLACDSPLGDGSVHLTGEMPGHAAPPRLSVVLDRIPVAAGLAALRILRSGLASDLDAKGSVSGKIVYAVAAPNSAQPTKPARPLRKHPAKAAPDESGPLNGAFTVSNFVLSGGGLTRPLIAPKITLQPVIAAQGAPQALAGTVAIPAGGAVPLEFNLRLSLAGYRVAVRGQTSFARAREIARAVGIPAADALASLAGEPFALDLTAAGPWLPPEQFSLTNGASPESAPIASPPQQSSAPPAIPASITPASDTLIGTVTLRNANWKADYLANHLVISDATLHFDNASLRWDPLAFTYGPLQGTASLTVPLDCPPAQQSDQQSAQPPEPSCPTQFQVHFGDLDAAAVQTTLLGAREKGTLLSDLIDRFHPSSAPPWPQLEGTVTADSLLLGPVTLLQVSAALRILPASAQIASFDAGLLGGTIHATGSLQKPATDQDKPDYTFDGEFQKVNAADVGRLVGLRWTGNTLDGNGKVELTGYTGKDFASSARGTLHFETRQGAIAALEPASALKSAATGDAPAPLPAALTRFNSFTADASIANGAITFSQDQLNSGRRQRSIQAAITFGDPPAVSFGAPKETHTQKR